MSITLQRKGVRPLTPLADGVLIAKGRSLHVADADLNPQRYLTTLPTSLPKHFATPFRLLRRVLRLEPSIAVAESANSVLVSNGNIIWSIDTQTGMRRHDFTIPDGRKALNITRVEGISGMRDGFYFGEYFENLEKNLVNVWFRPLAGGQWRVVHRFAQGQIDHVHDIVVDTQRQSLWVLTGDYADGAALWQAHHNFTSINAVLRGSQQYRAVWMYPFGEDFIYATDSNLEQNYLYRLRQVNGTWQAQPIAAIAGSSIYAALSGGRIYFSTTVEPGEPSGKMLHDLVERTLGAGIQDTRSHVYVYDGTLHEIFSAEKDRWPMRLCQFGVFHCCVVPTGDGVYLYGSAVKRYDGVALRVTS